MDIEQIKREVGHKLSGLIPHSYSDNTMLNTIDYLHSRGYLGGVPDGYVCVPKDPTEHMKNCGWAAFQTFTRTGRAEYEIYKAMIAAAPKGETK